MEKLSISLGNSGISGTRYGGPWELWEADTPGHLGAHQAEELRAQVSEERRHQASSHDAVCGLSGSHPSTWNHNAGKHCTSGSHFL